jgi:hypothetical protein
VTERKRISKPVPTHLLTLSDGGLVCAKIHSLFPPSVSLMGACKPKWGAVGSFSHRVAVSQAYHSNAQMTNLTNAESHFSIRPADLHQSNILEHTQKPPNMSRYTNPATPPNHTAYCHQVRKPYEQTQHLNARVRFPSRSRDISCHSD